jgi:hypothetical protein
MQDNNIYMLTNEISCNLDFMGYSENGLARCVDIKVSPSCHILSSYVEIYRGKHQNDKYGITNVAFY